MIVAYLKYALDDVGRLNGTSGSLLQLAIAYLQKGTAAVGMSQRQ